MDTVHTTAALLPEPAELRAHLRALAVLDQAICRDPRFSRFSFSTTWGPGTEAALMDNGSGDDFSVLFTPAGVLVRGFDHESEMSPYGTDDEQVWPGVIDEVPAALRPLLDDPAFVDEGLGAARVTACLWWETGGSAWRTGSDIEFPSDNPDPDGSGHLFRLLTDRSPEAVHAHFEEDYGRPVPLDTVRHVLAGHSLTPEAARGLNPAALSDEALLRRIAANPEIEAYLACDGEFDLTRTDPIESIALPAGLPVEAVAGCNAGGTHYICGPAGSDRVRPVLYTDSEGQASLIAESLAEALTLAIVLPSWHDALAGFRPPRSTPITLRTTRTTPRSATASSPPSASPRPPRPRSWPASSPRPPAASRTASSLRSRVKGTRPSNRCSVCRPSRTAPPCASLRTAEVRRAVEGRRSHAGALGG
ncbi:hypothetical protein [Streptomyces drozdowiczii]|uniref:hypothetical protein n=1 Tax=Streptomyces drozdowiczii TaxID=202862 RepID=UPI00403CC0FA